MKKLLLSLFLALVTLGVSAQREGVREEVRSDWNKASGLDGLYDMVPKAQTPAPKGYEPIYISHYGRHGSRFAYTDKAYTVLLEMLRAAEKEDNLTERGARLHSDMEAFWEKNRFRVGDLTPLGWRQHEFIAREMVRNYPSLFGKGSRVEAASSPTIRSIVSMTAFLSAFGAAAPRAEVYGHQSTLDIQAANPNYKKNPFRYKGPDIPFPYDENPEKFFLRKFPQYKEVLGRIFKDPEKGLGGRNPWEVYFNIYMLVAGMNSLEEEDRIPFDGFLSIDEFATLWETDNYERLREYLPYRINCSSVVEDIIAKADARLEGREKGADLRFGHDHVVMGLLLLMDIEDFGKQPSEADDVVKFFQSFRSPMAANLQFVFYTPKKCSKEKDVLVKLLLNGDESRIGKLEPVRGPYYKWAEVKNFFESRIATFVTERPKP